MNVASEHKLVRVWLRLLLGLVQMFLATTGIILLITIGVHPLTLVFVAAATSVTITSRLLYSKRSDHKPGEDE